MSSKLYRVTLVVQEDVLAKDEAEAFSFALESVRQEPKNCVGRLVAELPMGTGDFYSDEEE